MRLSLLHSPPPGGQGMSQYTQCVTCQLLTRLRGPWCITDPVWPLSMMSVWLWPLHWTDHNWALAVVTSQNSPAVPGASRRPGLCPACLTAWPAEVWFGQHKVWPRFNLSVSPPDPRPQVDYEDHTQTKSHQNRGLGHTLLTQSQNTIPIWLARLKILNADGRDELSESE